MSFVGFKKTYMRVLDKKIFLCYKKDLIWIRIRIGSGFINSLDLDPDSSKCLDPDPKQRRIPAEPSIQLGD
jgi:hypothetical protein